MACPGLCTADKIFLFINVAFAMYSGALLATGARLAWDPSTYAWFRYLCATQYRVTCLYVTCAGLWLLALVYLAAAAHAARRCLRAYCAGVACLAVSEVCYGAWMAASLAAWWRDSPRAELARRGMDLMHDIRPALLAVDRYRDLVRPVLDMLEEVEQKAPNNVYVIIVFAFVGLILQIAALVLSLRLRRRPAAAGALPGKAALAGPPPDEDSGSEAGEHAPPPGWRTSANLRMYTILDKIF